MWKSTGFCIVSFKANLLKSKLLPANTSFTYLPRMSRIKQFHDTHNVLLYFPLESAESSTVVLVYDPVPASASILPAEKAKHLDEVEKELRKLSKDAADVKSETLIVDKKWHDAIIGQGGTTLNAIIGEDKALAIKLGQDARKLVHEASNDDLIVVRGASADVDRASKEILRIVEEAKNDEIDNSHVRLLFLLLSTISAAILNCARQSVEFEIGREYVGKIVGAHGNGVNKSVFLPIDIASYQRVISGLGTSWA